MADFCAQCTDWMFPPKFLAKNDMKGLCTKEDNDKNLYAVVLCEGCGYIQVDYLGNCISKDCIENHGFGTEVCKE